MCSFNRYQSWMELEGPLLGRSGTFFGAEKLKKPVKVRFLAKQVPKTLKCIGDLVKNRPFFRKLKILLHENT